MAKRKRQTKLPFKKVKRSKSFSPKKKFNKKIKKVGVMRPSPRKAGTGHWLTTSTYFRKLSPSLFRTMKAVGKNYLSTSYAFQVVSVIGQQALYSTNSTWYSPYDITTMYANGTNVGNKLLMNSAMIKLMATNQSNAVQFIELYELTSKEHVAFNNTKVQNPKNAWLTDTTLDNDTGTLQTQIGTTPFGSRQFTGFYHVNKVTRYNLNPGETIEHIVSDKPNMVIDYIKSLNESSQTQPNTDGGSYKGLTKFFMIVQWSAPYNDVTTKTQVSTGAGNIDYIITRNYVYQPMPQFVLNNYSTVAVIPQAFTVAQDIMNDDSGAAVALANA